MHCTAVCFSQYDISVFKSGVNLSEKGIVKRSEVNFTKKLAYTFDHPTAEIAQRLRVGKDTNSQFEPRTKISL